MTVNSPGRQALETGPAAADNQQITVSRETCAECDDRGVVGTHAGVCPSCKGATSGLPAHIQRELRALDDITKRLQDVGPAGRKFLRDVLTAELDAS